MKIWLITVNFGETNRTKELIDSIPLMSKEDSIKVAIADNFSSYKSKQELEEIKKESKLEIEIFYFKKNYYYWPAANKILLNLKKTAGKLPDWVLICNNDITFLDDKFFKQLKKLNKNKFPIIGPSIINQEGKTLNPFLISPYSKTEGIFWNFYFLSFLISKIMILLKKMIEWFILKKSKNINGSNEKVYAIHGSAILFSKDFFMKGGYLDVNFEMYGEELSLAEIAKKLDLPIIYYPKLKVMHNEHSSTKKTNQKLMFQKARDSYYYINSTYFKQ